MQGFWDLLTGNHAFATLIILVAAFSLRLLANRWVDSRIKMEADERRRAKSNIKNSLFFIAVLALVFIWAPSLRTFALSLTAFVVAIILATKELILCLSGYVLKSSGGMIRVGDWIEINGIRGEIVDQDIMTTTMEELGTGSKEYDFTGRTVIIPNSTFLTATVKNERFNKRYTYHSFSVVVKPEVPTNQLRVILLKELSEAVDQFAEVSRRYKALIEKRAGIQLSDEFTQCDVGFLKDAHVQLTLTCFVPVTEATKIEHTMKAIAADYIAEWYANNGH